MSRQLSKKTLQKVCWRNMFPFQWSWNYETMQGSGYGWVVWPAMKELYGDDPEKMKEMLRAESGYFNTTPAMSHLIVGADLALQEELGTESKDMVMAMKSGLMGPFAGVGDTIFLAIYRAVFFSIASYFALDGVPFGLLIPIITGLFIIFTRYKFTFLGYSQGKKLASEFADRIAPITECASILGLTVVGGLVASVVTYSLDLEFVVGEATLSVQSYLDTMMPKLIPLVIVLFSYWLLGKKKINSTKLIFVLLALGMVLGNLSRIFGV